MTDFGLFITAITLISLAACSQERATAHVTEAGRPQDGLSDLQETRPPIHSPKGIDDLGAGERYQLPEHLRFDNVTSILLASTWQELLATMSVDDAEFLSRLDEKYNGGLSFTSIEEQRWAISQGIPMPEDWLAAKSMSDTELEEQARSGRFKDQMIFADRVYDRISSEKSRHTDGIHESRFVDQRIAATAMATSQLQRTRSPFAAYILGRLDSVIYADQPSEPIAAAIATGKDLGDPRADRISRAFYAKHSDVNAESVLAIYNSTKSMLTGK